MSVLNVQLFGHFAASLNGTALTTLNTSRLQALFACLLLCPQALFRQHLAYQFWPDSSESQARTNLRNLVYLLRQALPDFEIFIQSDAKTLQWRKDAPVRLDVHEFEQLLAFSPGRIPDREKLERAVSLYQGDLLPDCYEDWIIPERERLRRAFLAALEAVAETSEKNRDYPAALLYTRRLLQEDPFHAAGNRQLIRLHALTGNQAAALKAYEAYADLLMSELGITPEPETQALYEQLSHSSMQSLPSAPEPAPMVGRHNEWGMVQAAWRHATRGNPGALFITGEAGIGKTRLVEELMHWASRQGLRTAVASCYPAEGSLPYAPVVNWLRSRPLPRLDTIWLTEISRLVPEVLHAYPKLAAPKPLTESWQRQRMFEALVKAVLGEHQALLLVIEDIHWCDQDTLEWLHYLLRYDARSPFLLVATERSGETAAMDHPLKKLQTTLAAADKYSQIKLHPLNEAECWQLAAQVAEERTGQRLQAEFAAHILRETEGNPLFVVEMVRLGHPFQTQVQRASESASLSDKVQRVLNWRIDQLSAPTRELACMAATLGREFPLDVLQQASGLEETDLVKALNELLLRQIVHEQTPDRYDFTHDKLRQAVLSGLSSAHLRLLHRKAAEAYLHLTGNSIQPRNAEIAGHYEAAGLVQPAVQYYRLAAESAENIFSTADAIHNLKRAVELVDATGAGMPTGISPDELAAMLVKMGDLLALDGKYPQAQTHFERGLAQAISQSALWRSQTYIKLSDALTAQYQHAQAHAALNQAEQALHFSIGGRTLAEKSEWIQIQLARIQTSYWENNPDRMEELIQKVSPIVEAAGSIEQKIALLSTQYMLRLRRERYRLSQETVEMARRKLELCETLADPFALAATQFQYGFALLWHGDLGEAQEWLATGYAATGRIGARLWQLRALAYLCVANRILNNLTAVREQTQELLEMAPAINEPTYYGIGQANLGWLAWRDGDAVKASQLCHAAIETWRQFGQEVFHGLAYWVLLAVAISRSDLRQAQEYTRSLLDPDPHYQPVEEPIAVILGQALNACQAQDTHNAFTLFNQALEKAREAGEL